jgi:predicted RNase H-like nuclease (RuvC/YqgF family)
MRDSIETRANELHLMVDALRSEIREKDKVIERITEINDSYRCERDSLVSRLRKEIRTEYGREWEFLWSEVADLRQKYSDVTDENRDIREQLKLKDNEICALNGGVFFHQLRTMNADNRHKQAIRERNCAFVLLVVATLIFFMWY